jgi:hypothetical protein
MVTFYADWSALIDFTNIFTKLSNNYLKFGMVDVGRFTAVAAEYHINTSYLITRLVRSLSRYQVSINIFYKPHKFILEECKYFDVCQLSFDLKNLYKKCKEDIKLCLLS